MIHIQLLKKPLNKLLYFLMEMIHKFRLRRAYYVYNQMMNEADCGHSLRRYISPKVEVQKRKCDEIYDLCISYKEKREKRR